MLAHAFLTFFVVGFLRALPWPPAWKQRKPLSCHACMAGWVLIGTALVERWTARCEVHTLLGGAGLALLLLRWLDTKTSLPFSSGEELGPPES